MIPLANPTFGGNELAYVTDALARGEVTTRGSYVAKLEAGWAKLHGLKADQALACSSGTAALHLALLALGIGPGDQVIVPSVTFAATASVVMACGATVVLADIDGLTITAETIDAVWTPKVKAVIPVHLYGEMAPMDEIMALADERNFWVIEDACECVEPFAPQGQFACFSFFANKSITTGEGGIVLSAMREPLRWWRDFGLVNPEKQKEYHHDLPGLNYRMTNIQAAIGCAQLERYEQLQAARSQNIRFYQERGIQGRGRWLYVVPTRPMETVETRPVFKPLHLLPPYRSDGKFPGAMALWRDHMCLPCGPHLDGLAMHQIINEYLGQEALAA